MAPILVTLKARATVGEIADVFREMSGNIARLSGFPGGGFGLRGGGETGYR